MLIDDERYQLQSDEADFVHLNAGIGLQLLYFPPVNTVTLHSITTWWASQKLMGTQLWEVRLRAQCRTFCLIPQPVYVECTVVTSLATIITWLASQKLVGT